MDCNGYDKYLLGAQNLDMVLIVAVLWEMHRECDFSHFVHMSHSFLQFYMHEQDIYVRVNISNMEMCSSSDSPQIDSMMSLLFPSPWPSRRPLVDHSVPTAALHGSSVHTTMWLKMVLLWVCDCAFYFWQDICTYIIDMNLKSQMLTSILGVTEVPPTWILGFLLDEAHPTFIPGLL